MNPKMLLNELCMQNHTSELLQYNTRRCAGSPDHMPTFQCDCHLPDLLSEPGGRVLVPGGVFTSQASSKRVVEQAAAALAVEHVLRAAAAVEPLLQLPMELRLQLARRREGGLAAMESEPEPAQLQQRQPPASAPYGALDAHPLPGSPPSLPPGTAPGTTFQTPRQASPLPPGEPAADGAAPPGHSTPPAPTDLPRPSFAGSAGGSGGDAYRSRGAAQAAQQQQEPAASLFPAELADEAIERMQAPELRRWLRQALQTIDEQRQRLFQIGLLAGVQ